MSKETCSVKRTSIGGQALIEGVMMRGPQKTAMAVRHTSGEIRTDIWDTEGGATKGVRKIPFVRGIFNFIDSMVSGYKSLMKSAQMCGVEEELGDAMVEEQREKARKKAEKAGEEFDETAFVPVDTEKQTSKLMGIVTVVSVFLGVVLAVALFFWLPSQLYRWICMAAPQLDHQVLRAVFEGLFRIVLLLGYMVAVSYMQDIRRVFMYHGAEHKTIFCYENGLELTVENVRKQSRFHPRCGTSFLVLMVLIGMLVAMLITADNPLLRTAIKLLSLPIIMGIGYEAIKFAGRKDNAFTRIISAPGLWMQRITTKEPDDSMIECAIKAFVMVMPENERPVEESAAPEENAEE